MKMISLLMLVLATSFGVSTMASGDVKECKIREVAPSGMFNLYIGDELVTPNDLYSMTSVLEQREKFMQLGVCQMEQNLPICKVEVGFNDGEMFGVSFADYKPASLLYSVVSVKKWRDQLVSAQICQLPNLQQTQLPKCELKEDADGFFSLYLDNQLTFLKQQTYVSALEWKNKLVELLVCNAL